MGHTKGYVKVLVPLDANLPGRSMLVNITKASRFHIEGSIVYVVDKKYDIEKKENETKYQQATQELLIQAKQMKTINKEVFESVNESTNGLSWKNKIVSWIMSPNHFKWTTSVVFGLTSFSMLIWLSRIYSNRKLLR